MSEKERLNALTDVIIKSAIEVHKEMGPGLLESAYEAFLAHELLTRGYMLERQKPLPVTYRGERLDLGYRVDLLVEDSVIVEVKAVERFHRIHGAQLVSYLRQSGLQSRAAVQFQCEMVGRRWHHAESEWLPRMSSSSRSSCGFCVFRVDRRPRQRRLRA